MQPLRRRWRMKRGEGEIGLVHRAMKMYMSKVTMKLAEQGQSLFIVLTLLSSK